MKYSLDGVRQESHISVAKKQIDGKDVFISNDWTLGLDMRAAVGMFSAELAVGCQQDMQLNDEDSITLYNNAVHKLEELEVLEWLDGPDEYGFTFGDNLQKFMSFAGEYISKEIGIGCEVRIITDYCIPRRFSLEKDYIFVALCIGMDLESMSEVDEELVSANNYFQVTLATYHTVEVEPFYNDHEELYARNILKLLNKCIHKFKASILLD